MKQPLFRLIGLLVGVAPTLLAVSLGIGGFNPSRGGAGSIENNATLRSIISARFPGTTYTTTGTLTAAYLGTVSHLIISAGAGDTLPISPLSAAEQSALLNFVRAGGTALLFCDNDSFGPNANATSNSLVAPFGLSTTGTLTFDQTSTIVAPTHPVIMGPAGTVTRYNSSFPGWFSSVGNATVLARLTANNQPSLAVLLPGALNPGSGAVVFFSDATLRLIITNTALPADDVNHNTLILNSLSLPVPKVPAIQAGGVVSASAFGQFSSVAPGSWIEIFGSNFAATTRSWQGSDFNGTNAPTALDGTRVTIGGQSAFIAYVSPDQLNVQVPSSVALGAQPLVVTTQTGPSAAYTVNVNSRQPGLLAPSSFVVSSVPYVVALFPDGTFALPPGAIGGIVSRRARPGDTLTLYGVGFGAVTPDIPAGQVVQRDNRLAGPLRVFFGDSEASVSFAGLAPNAIGLYQFNVVVPGVADSDSVPLTFTLDGASGQQRLFVPVRR